MVSGHESHPCAAYLHRWSWAIYGIGPLGAYVVATTTIVALVGVWLNLSDEYLAPEAFHGMVTLGWVKFILERFSLFVTYPLSLVAAAATCIFAARRAMSIGWLAVGVVFVLIFASGIHVGMEYPATLDGYGTFGGGWGLSLGAISRSLLVSAIILGTYSGWRKLGRANLHQAHAVATNHARQASPTRVAECRPQAPRFGATAMATVLSIALHTILLFALSHIEWPPARPRELSEPVARIVWLGTLGVRAESAKTGADEQDAVKLSEALRSATGAGEAISPAFDAAEPPEIPPSSAASENARQSTTRIRPGQLADAQRQAIAATRERREQEASYQDFTFPSSASSSGMTKQRSGRQRGEQERGQMGEWRVWTSTDCYLTYSPPPMFALPATAGVFAIPTRRCVRVHTPRSDLFEDLAPDYLQQERDGAN
jgi:hypothetical protein